jgi:23S rRNA (pseudouridine1915-N3)-methyltransferase
VKLRIVWIGKTKDPRLAQLTTELVERSRRFVAVEVAELKDPKAKDSQHQLVQEEERLLAALDKDDRVIILDAAGTTWSSPQFASFLGKHLRGDPRRLTFIIGGYGGLGDRVKARAERAWSLSPLTFTHELARVLVAEQIYRGLCILNNHPYAK